MSYKSNTDKIKLMKQFQHLLKYAIIAVIFIFFLGSVIQTVTYFQISVKGTFFITPLATEKTITLRKSNGLQEEVTNKSGVLFLTTLGRNKGPGYRYNESAWGEVVGDKGRNVEEMNEGKYRCRTLLEKSCWNKYAWETDDSWDPTTSKLRSSLQDLYNNGRVRLPYQPNNSDTGDNQMFVGTILNPDLSANKGNRFKEHMYRHTYAGFPMFLVAIPFRGHFIKHVYLRNYNTNEGYAVKWEEPTTNPSCGSTCSLGFDNDFLHKNCRDYPYKQDDINQKMKSSYNQGWFGKGGITPFCFSETRSSTSPVNRSFSGIPDLGQLNLGVTRMMPIYSLSPNSIFYSRNCQLWGSSCAEVHGEGSRITTNLWNRVWGEIEAEYSDVLSGLRAPANDNGVTTVSGTDGEYLQPRVPGEPAIMAPDSYLLNDGWLRSEQPVVFAIGSVIEGAEAWILDAVAGSGPNGERNYPLKTKSSRFQVHIEFAQLGYRFYTLINQFDDNAVASSTNARQHLVSVMNWDQDAKLKYINQQDANGSYVYNIPYDYEVNYTFGGNDTCINSIDFDAYKFSGGVKTQGPSGNNILTFPLAIGETKTSSNVIGHNYDFLINTFPPKFFIKTEDKGEYGAVSHGGYLYGHPDLDTETVASPYWAKTQAEIATKLRTQKTLGSVPNQIASCGFLNSYQEINIAPKIDDFYYFDNITGVNADIYVRNLKTIPASPNYEKLDKTPGTGNLNFVQYSVNPIKVYAKVSSNTLSTLNAYVTVFFKQFPSVQFLQTKLASNLEGRISQNRLVTAPDEVDSNDCKRDLIYGGSEYNRRIQPRTFGDNNSNCNSLEVTFHKKLQRLYLTYDTNETPIVIYTDESNPKETLATPPVSVDEQTMPNGANKTKNGSSLLLPTSLSLNNDGSYKLTIPSIGKNTQIYVEFTPFIVKFYQSTTTNITSTMTMTPTPANGVLAGSATSLNIIEVGDSSGTNLTNSAAGIKAKRNEKKKVDMTMKDGDLRKNYYIYDITEVSVSENNSVLTSNSKIADHFTNLKTNLFHFLDKVNSTEYETSAIVYETQVWVSLENYYNINVTFVSANATSDLGSVSVLYQDLVAPGPIDAGQTSENIKSTEAYNQFKPFKPNTIYTSASTLDKVAFRRWDKATMKIIPGEAYEVDTVERAYEENGTYENILSTLPNSLNPFNAKDLVIDGVSRNIWLKVKFRRRAESNLIQGMTF